MCGLVGVINKYVNGFNNEHQKVFSTLLLVDYLRGPDSTGLFSVSNKGNVGIAKEANNPCNFMASKEYDDVMKSVWKDGSALIGHNRKATRGTVNDTNAHPFVVDDNIVLVHNGTMYGDHKKIADVEVDSHAIAHAIHEKGTVTEALSSFDAAYALIWYDFKAGTLNLIRNKDRPLWWMETDNAWIWCSEKSMLDFVTARENLKVKEKPTELPEDVLQTYTLKDGRWDVDSEKLKITKPVFKPTFTRGYHGGSQEDYYAEARQNYRRTMNLDGADWENEVPVTVSPRVTATTPASGTISDFELKLAKSNNKIVTNDQFQHHIINSYPIGKKVLCRTFDYTYKNLKDDTDGFYLYSAATDDDDVIFRHHFLKRYMDENRMIQIAGGEYVYEFEIERKWWGAFAPGHVVGQSAGYCIVESKKATLKWGGGVGDVGMKNALAH